MRGNQVKHIGYNSWNRSLSNLTKSFLIWALFICLVSEISHSASATEQEEFEYIEDRGWIGALYGYSIDENTDIDALLVKHYTSVKNSLESLRLDAMTLNKERERSENEILTFIKDQEVSANTRAFVESFLIGDEYDKSITIKVVVIEKAHQDYLKTIRAAQELIAKPEIAALPQSAKKALVLDALYNSEAEGNAYFRYSQRHHNLRFHEVEIYGVEVSRENFRSLKNMRKLLPTFQNKPLFEAEEGSNFQPVEIHSPKIDLRELFWVINGDYYYLSDKHYMNFLIVSMDRNANYLNLFDDIKLIDRILWSEKAKQPLKVNFVGKAFGKTRGYVKRKHTFYANMKFGYCGRSTGSPFGFYTEPCLKKNKFDMERFKAQLQE